MNRQEALAAALHRVGAELDDPFDAGHPVGMHNSQAAALASALRELGWDVVPTGGLDDAVATLRHIRDDAAYRVAAIAAEYAKEADRG